MKTNATLDKTITVTGIKFWNWTITANVIATFNYDPNTNTFSHTQNSIGVNDGDIVGQGNNASIPNISFSNHVSVDAVRWAKMTADAGMGIGQRDDWIDAIYESDALRDAITHEGEFLSAIAAIVKEERDEACAAIEKPAQKASKFRNLTQQVNDVLDLTRGYDPNSLVGRMAALLEQTTFYKDLYYNTLTPAQRDNPVPPKE